MLDYEYDEAKIKAELASLPPLDLLPSDYDAYDIPPGFGPEDFALDSQINTRIHAPLKSKPLHPRLIKHSNALALAREIGPLAEVGARVDAVVNGNFIFGDFIEAWIAENNWLVPDLHIATLSLSQENIDSLANLLHGDFVRRIHLYVSDYWFSHERHKNGLVPYAYRELDLGGDAFQLTVTGSHAKIALIETDLGARYCLHGSANLRSSASIEQITLEHHPELHAFHRDWLTRLETHYSTIHPDQPGPAAPKDQQWQQVALTPDATPPAAKRRRKTTPPPPANAAPKSDGAAPERCNP